jgi:hypothetical protein
VSLVSFGTRHGLDRIPRKGVPAMEKTLVIVPSTHVPGIAVSVDQGTWRRMRRSALALGGFPTATTRGVSAGGRRT